MLNVLKKRLKGGSSSAEGPPGISAPSEIPSGRNSSPAPALSAPAAGSTAFHGTADGDLPRADVGLPVTRHERRHSSVMRDCAPSGPKLAFQALLRDPATHVLLKDCPSSKRDALFKTKLTLCTFTEFDWESTTKAEISAIDAKKNALFDLKETLNTPAGARLLTESVYGDAIAMVNANIFRAFPPSRKGSAAGGEEVTGVAGGEGEDDEPALVPGWPHLLLAYEFLLRFVMSAEVKVKAAKKYIDAVFCAKLIGMFESDDPREREYLKTILHRIYGKFMSHRAFIRKAISHVFIAFVYETERHAGVGELLEILGSIINGFALPLKPEHITFLEKSLLPLYRPRSLVHYNLQLGYCVLQYVEKDRATSILIIQNIIRFWPAAPAAKQIALLGSVEDILDMAEEAALPVLPDLLRLLSRCVGSSHFQVAERALLLWQNEKLVKTGGLLSGTHVAAVLPALYPALIRNGTGHWNPSVEGLAQFVLKVYEESDPALYAQCEEGAEVGAGADSGRQSGGEVGAGAGASSTGSGSNSAAAARERAARWKVVEAAACKNHSQLFTSDAAAARSKRSGGT